MPITPQDFEYIRCLVRERAAIVLDGGKEYLAESRLAPVARSIGASTVGELVGRLRVEPRGDLSSRVIEAMTTNETSFFRDLLPFDALRTAVLPALSRLRASERMLDLWCAASSSGQEPYSVAMLIREHFPQLVEWRIRFVASDISTEMLRRCREGIYSQLEVNRGLPARYLVKYFEKRGLEWQIKPEIRDMVEFTELNLAHAWPSLPQFDIVFIRNVLIYFDLPTKRAILGRIRKLMKPDSYLFLGGAETTLNVDDSFRREPADRTFVYRPGGGGARP